jgi:hypothetical protein
MGSVFIDRLLPDFVATAEFKGSHFQERQKVLCRKISQL